MVQTFNNYFKIILNSSSIFKLVQPRLDKTKLDGTIPGLAITRL